LAHQLLLLEQCVYNIFVIIYASYGQTDKTRSAVYNKDAATYFESLQSTNG